MSQDDRGKWDRLPKINIDSRTISKHMRKVETATVRHTHKFLVKRWSNVREVQRHVIGWILTVGILIAATGLQLMWYQNGYLTKVAADDGTYAEAVLGPINSLNPIFTNSSAEQSASYLMFSRIMRYDKTGRLNYDLATDIQADDASNVYTVTIRPDARWHDGAVLTTDDIAFTIELIKNPNVHSTITGWDDVGVKIINATTIQFTLRSTYAAFGHALTFPILPKHILGDILPSKLLENKFSQSPIGSGPFRYSLTQDISSAGDNKIISMDRNDSYYGGKAKLARFLLHTYGTTGEITDALSTNKVSAAADLSSSDVNNLAKDKYLVSYKPVQSGVYAIINTRSKILSDVTLRRALRLATSTDAIRKKLPSAVLALDLPFTNGQLSGELPVAPKYDVEAAKKIFDDNGWKLNSKNIREKDGQQLTISVVTMKNSELEGTLETLSGQWRSIGLNVETRVADPTDVSQNVAQTILQPRNFDVLVYQLNVGADPDIYAYWHSSQVSSKGLNFSNYSNIISDDALTSARSVIDPTLRNAKYITFANQWLADVPAIGLYQPTVQYVYGNSVRSVDETTKLISAIDRYSDILNWSVGTETVFKTP